MKVYIETYGCTMNQGDSEILKALVAEEHEVVEDPSSCDAVVVNSCGVIKYTERKILRRVSDLKSAGKKVLVAGCLPKINRKAVEGAGADVLLTPQSLRRIGEALGQLSGRRRLFEGVEARFEKAAVPKVRRSDCVAIIPIAEGCLGFCSYCATRFARGQLRSFELEGIVKEARDCVAKGYRELQLTAQDAAVYGRETGSSLPELLERICRIDGEFRVRVGMMNPGYAAEILEDLIRACRDNKIYKFFHLPLQSGDNEVLRHMQRGYTVEHFAETVNALRKNFNPITLATDIIVGYPTEDDASFQRTFDLLCRIKPDILNITRFSPREGTRAFGMKDMPDRFKKERSRKLTSLHEKISYRINNNYVGMDLDVLITENGKTGSMLGRTNFYKQVVIQRGEIGQIRKVKVTDAKHSYLIGD